MFDKHEDQIFNGKLLPNGVWNFYEILAFFFRKIKDIPRKSQLHLLVETIDTGEKHRLTLAEADTALNLTGAKTENDHRAP